LAIVNEAQKQQELPAGRVIDFQSGFDIIVGNPPFVTARNPKKRELYRERWPRVCYGTYLLVCPFFEMSFGLLKPKGQLGFIVSNAFAKREFGKPLVEDFFPKVEIQKVLDCSGLMFPGHGTPTCLVFGRNTKPDAKSPIRVATIVPGGGDLRTPPEESPLWRTLEEHNDQPGYSDERVIVADRSRVQMARWPWDLDSDAEPTRQMIERGSHRLADVIDGDVGFCTKTNADDVFLVSSDHARRNCLPPHLLFPYHQGKEVRNWWAEIPSLILLPYNRQCEILEEKDLGQEALNYLRPFKKLLEERHSFGNKTFKELGWPWFAFDRMNANKYRTDSFITFPLIATHNHYVFIHERRVFGRHP